MKKFALLFAALFAFALTLYNAHPSGALSTGRVGRSGNPATGGLYCSQCHQGGDIPTVEMSGATTLFAGSQATYSLTISGGELADATNAAPMGGFNVSATMGDLSPLAGATDTQLMTEVTTGREEITHTNPKAPNGDGEVAFDFMLTVPMTATAGTYTLYGSGNGVDGTGATV